MTSRPEKDWWKILVDKEMYEGKGEIMRMTIIVVMLPDHTLKRKKRERWKR